jgi:AcrR family transcriptional regulator
VPADTADGQRIDGRTDHKPRTRQALIDAALTLFADRGYEATSVDEIAQRAGVSPRTFFRYFETKDRVLFFGGDDYNAAVVRHVPEQPPELGDLAALEATSIALTPLLVPLKPRIRLYFTALESSPALLGQHVHSTARQTAAVAAALAARRSLLAPDERCELAAALASVAQARAYQRWLGSDVDLADLVVENYAAVRALALADAVPGPVSSGGQDTPGPPESADDARRP